MKKITFIFILGLISGYIFSGNAREYQFISDQPNTSYFIIEGGTNLSLSLHINNVELSGGYSFFLGDGFNLSSDLYMLNSDFIFNTTVHLGIGGGIIFNPSLINGFTSDIYLRLPVRIAYNNWFFKVNPMAGTSMFEQNIQFKFAISLSIGYMFDLYHDNKVITSEEP